MDGNSSVNLEDLLALNGTIDDISDNRFYKGLFVNFDSLKDLAKGMDLILPGTHDDIIGLALLHISLTALVSFAATFLYSRIVFIVWKFNTSLNKFQYLIMILAIIQLIFLTTTLLIQRVSFSLSGDTFSVFLVDSFMPKILLDLLRVLNMASDELFLFLSCSLTFYRVLLFLKPQYLRKFYHYFTFFFILAIIHSLWLKFDAYYYFLSALSILLAVVARGYLTRYIYTQGLSPDDVINQRRLTTMIDVQIAVAITCHIGYVITGLLLLNIQDKGQQKIALFYTSELYSMALCIIPLPNAILISWAVKGFLRHQKNQTTIMEPTTLITAELASNRFSIVQ